MNIGWRPHSGKFTTPQKPNTIVLHALAEFVDFDGVDKTGWEHVDNLGWGAHYYVYPSGVVIQSIRNNTIGAHARGHNSDTIGIEFIVPGLLTYQKFSHYINDVSWVSEKQLQAGVELINQLIKDEGIKWVTTHAHLDPERKIDPGYGFPYERMVAEVNLAEDHIQY